MVAIYTVRIPNLISLSVKSTIKSNTKPGYCSYNPLNEQKCWADQLWQRLSHRKILYIPSTACVGSPQHKERFLASSIKFIRIHILGLRYRKSRDHISGGFTGIFMLCTVCGITNSHMKPWDYYVQLLPHICQVSRVSTSNLSKLTYLSWVCVCVLLRGQGRAA